MLKTNDSVVGITGGGIGSADTGHWVNNGGRAVLGDVAKEASL